MLSDLWPYGEVTSHCDVFSDTTGYSNRGTFSSIGRESFWLPEMKQLGAARDQRL